jgi:hypothetical protein
VDYLKSQKTLNISIHHPPRVTKTGKEERKMSTKIPITLPVEAIDDLIYDARAGDLDALKSDLAALSTQHSCPQAWIMASAIDSEPEEEGGTGSCLLHFPAANGNSGTFLLFTRPLFIVFGIGHVVCK